MNRATFSLGMLYFGSIRLYFELGHLSRCYFMVSASSEHRRSFCRRLKFMTVDYKMRKGAWKALCRRSATIRTTALQRENPAHAQNCVVAVGICRETCFFAALKTASRRKCSVRIKPLPREWFGLPDPAHQELSMPQLRCLIYAPP